MSPPDEGSVETATVNRASGEEHPLQSWMHLHPGDIVSLSGPGKQKLVGTVETGTNDGLIIWVRNDLNERKMVHVHDVDSVRVIDNSRTTELNALRGIPRETA